MLGGAGGARTNDQRIMSPIQQLARSAEMSLYPLPRSHGSKRRQDVSLRRVLGRRWDESPFALAISRASVARYHVELRWQVQDSNLRRRKPTDLQSVPGVSVDSA